MARAAQARVRRGDIRHELCRRDDVLTPKRAVPFLCYRGHPEATRWQARPIPSPLGPSTTTTRTSAPGWQPWPPREACLLEEFRDGLGARDAPARRATVLIAGNWFLTCSGSRGIGYILSAPKRRGESDDDAADEVA